MIKQVIITFWFKELEYNPISKVGELENSLGNYLNSPFLINDQEPFINIGMPRIIAKNSDNTINFNMSLVNANLNILYNSVVSKDEVMLQINEMVQLIYDVLKEIYNLDILYNSIKVEVSKKIDNKFKLQKELLIDNKKEYEDFLIKTSVNKDNKFYINRIISVAKELKVDIKLPKNIKPLEQDMITRSMLVSLTDSKECCDLVNNVIEINNRLSYNNDDSYLVQKNDLRDLLFEFKMLLNNEIED